jgi:hypothetical protein
MVFGILLIALAIVVVIWESSSKKGVPRALRGATIGLLDLEILIGIVTWIVRTPHWSFVWHPIFMIVAVLIAHIMTTMRRPRSQRVIGWIIADVILILGAVLFYH